MVVLTFVLHPMITDTFVQYVIHCKQRDVSLLVVNTYVACGASLQMRLLQKALIGILIYSFGIPVGFAILLHKYSDRLKKPNIRSVLGFLYTGFEHRFYYFECIFMLRKVLVSFLVHIALPENIPMATPTRLIAVGIVSLMIMVWARPFEKRHFQMFDKLDYASMVSFTCTCLLELIIQTQSGHSNGQNGDSAQLFSAFLLISMHSGVLLFFVRALAHQWVVGFVRKRQQFWSTPDHHAKTCQERALRLGGLRIGMHGALDLSCLSSYELGGMRHVLHDISSCIAQRGVPWTAQHVSDFVQAAFSSVIHERIMNIKRMQRRIEGGNSSHILSTATSLSSFIGEESLRRISTNTAGGRNVTLHVYASFRRAALMHNQFARVTVNPCVSVEELHDEVLRIVDFVHEGSITIDETNSQLDEESWGWAALLFDEIK